MRRYHCIHVTYNGVLGDDPTQGAGVHLQRAGASRCRFDNVSERVLLALVNIVSYRMAKGLGQVWPGKHGWSYIEPAGNITDTTVPMLLPVSIR